MTKAVARRLALVLAVTATAAACATAAASAAAGPVVVQDVTFAGARVSSPLHATVTGQITCTKGAHFHLYGWILDRTNGALAKGKLPPKVRRGSAAEAQYKAATRCTGAPQAWSMSVAVSVTKGKRPVPLVAGSGEVCAIIALSKSHQYVDLKPFCGSVTIG